MLDFTKNKDYFYRFKRKEAVKFALAFFLICFSTIINNSQCYGQAAGSPQSEPVIVRYADSLVGNVVNGKEVKSLLGKVWFEHKNIVLKCNKAVQHVTDNWVDLVGNVVITQEDMILKSPHIIYDGKTGVATSVDTITITDSKSRLGARNGKYDSFSRIAYFNNNVRIFTGNAIIDCDTLEYNRNTEISIARSNVNVNSDSANIQSDYAEYSRRTLENFATGNVVATAKYNSAILTADTLYHKPNDKLTLAIGKPILMKLNTVKTNKDDSAKLAKDSNAAIRDTNGVQNDSNAINKNLVKDSKIVKDSSFVAIIDTMTISADSISARGEGNSQIYFFNKSVEIIRGSVAAKSEYAIYDRSIDQIFLRGVAVFWYDSTQLNGDSITVYVPDNHLSNIIARGNALAVTKNDTSYQDMKDQISGDEIHLKFEKDSLRLITSRGGARSLYFFIPGDSTEGGAAANGADTIIIRMDKGKLEKILWLSGVEGKFLPENAILANPRSYYLPSFRWSDTRPKKKEMRIRQK